MSQRCLLHIFGIAGSYSVLYIATSPWFFMRGGLIDLRYGALRVVGNASYYWSSTASTSASNAYGFRLDIDATYPSYSVWCWFGNLIRYVASGFYLSSSPYHARQRRGSPARRKLFDVDTVVSNSPKPVTKARVKLLELAVASQFQL